MVGNNNKIANILKLFTILWELSFLLEQFCSVLTEVLSKWVVERNKEQHKQLNTMNATNLRNSIVLGQSAINVEIRKEVSNICLLALSCNEMLEESSNDTFIQLDKSIFDNERKEYVDGFGKDKHGRLFFSTSTYSDYIYTREIWDLEMSTLERLLAQLEKMAEDRI